MAESLTAAVSLSMPDRLHAFYGLGADPGEIDEASRGGEVAGLHVDQRAVGPGDTSHEVCDRLHLTVTDSVSRISLGDAAWSTSPQ
jgi:hypothetical protein